jgi:phytoene synthase
MGRIYIPRADLARFDIDEHLHGDSDDLIGLISFEAGRACEWYDKGLPLLDMLDRRSRACTAAMAGIYRKLLDKIRRDPAAVMSGRISLPALDKSAVALKAILTGHL